MVVMALGYVTRRGWYDAEALQVFNRRQRGGRYWFAHGWNWRGMGTWIVSAVVALLFTNLPGQFVGPLGNLANGADISLPVGLALAVVLYLAALVVFPEPRAVFGPAGPRFVPASDADITPITGAPRRRPPSPPRRSDPSPSPTPPTGRPVLTAGRP
jgi:hypothetical protein